MKISGSLRRLPFLLLMAVALLLRLQNWHPFLVVDEDTILTMVWGLHLDPLPAGMPLPLPGYPPFFIYLNYLLSLLYREALIFLGVFSSAAEFFASPVARNFTLKAGQFLVAVMGTCHVAVIWTIGKEFFDRRVAWLAALLLAFHPHLVLNGHIFKSDVPLALLFSLLLLFSLRFLKTLSHKEFFAASFLAGMATACKYNGAVEALILPFLLWVCRKDLAQGRWRRLLLLSPLFGLLGFLVFAPNWAAHPLASLKAAYRYAVFHFQEFTFYDQVSSTYGRYVTDLWQTIGPLFLFFFLAGLVFVVLERKKEEVVIAFSIFLYFVVQGRSVFFGSRIILPILGAVALLAATGAFRHLAALFKSPAWRRTFTLVIFFATVVFALSNTKNSLSLFNLWKSASTLEEAASFRNEHIPARFPFGRENFTPVRAGDRGYWDILGIPDDNLFQGPKALPFLTTGILTDHLLNGSANRDLKERLNFRLREYRVFHRISKPRFGPWDGDVLFWYRPHPRLRAIHHGHETVFLPRLFRSNGISTLFYPLQPYEKDPGFFQLFEPFFAKWILSSQPLTGVSTVLFCPSGKVTARVKVNGHETVLNVANGTAQSDFPLPVPLARQRTPLYRIEVILPETHPAVFLLLRTKPATSAKETLGLTNSLENDPPAAFSGATPPGWVREFYRKTGVDLSLLTLTQGNTIWENRQRSLLPFSSEWMALARGVYRWEIEVEKLLTASVAGDPPPLAINVFSKDRFTTEALAWEKITDGRYVVFFEILEENTFLKADSGDFRKKGLLLLSLSIRPDYFRSIRQGLVFKKVK